MEKGIVKWFNNEKGYGYITGQDGTDAFVHHTGIKSDGFRTLEAGASVSYDVQQTERGLKATNVCVIHEG